MGSRTAEQWALSGVWCLGWCSVSPLAACPWFIPAEGSACYYCFLLSPGQAVSSWMQGCICWLSVLSSLLVSPYILLYPLLVVLLCGALRHASVLSRDFFLELQMATLLNYQGERKRCALVLSFLWPSNLFTFSRYNFCTMLSVLFSETETTMKSF